MEGSILGNGTKASNMEEEFIFQVKEMKNMENGTMERGLDGLKTDKR